MVGIANPSDTSTEAFRGSDPGFDSTFDSDCSPKKVKISPIKKMKKNKRVKLNLLNLPTTKGSDSEEDYYEEPDSPLSPSHVWPSCDSDATITNSSLKVLNELPTRLESAEDYKNAWCTPEAERYFAKLTLELAREERDVYISVGRGCGSHQIRNYLSRPPVQIKKFHIATDCPCF